MTAFGWTANPPRSGPDLHSAFSYPTERPDDGQTVVWTRVDHRECTSEWIGLPEGVVQPPEARVTY